MSKCKYSKCDVDLDNPKAHTCCDAHRKAWKREGKPGQNNPDKPEQPTRTDDNPDTCHQPGQPIDSQTVDGPLLHKAAAPGPLDLDKIKHPLPMSQSTLHEQQAANPYGVVVGEKRYGRRAVCYLVDKWATRPEPYDPTDTPCPRNRCKYTRVDGSEYMIDACGQPFDKIDGQYQPEVQPCKGVSV